MRCSVVCHHEKVRGKPGGEATAEEAEPELDIATLSQQTHGTAHRAVAHGDALLTEQWHTAGMLAWSFRKA
ncbi:MAG: hypothetical protein QUV05_15120 [Phycisphaerae bacterium]|nr:hypothetical protein [Phycisphaerae bacterium]